MAIKKPIVFNNGTDLQELQAGDTLDTQPDDVQMTATSTLAKGEVVYIDGSDSVDLAQANASGTSTPFGFAAEAISAAAVGAITYDGIVTATTGDWDNVIDNVGTGGLTPGTVYFLSPNAAGKILPASELDAQLVTAEYSVRVGQALSATVMRVEVQFHRIQVA